MIIKLSPETERELKKAFKKQRDEVDFCFWVRKRLKEVVNK